MKQILDFVIKHSQLPESGVKNTIQLLNEDCTIPFIARYRKERTGNLDEVQIELIVKYKEQFEVLEKRKKAILKALQEQEVLSKELQEKINRIDNLIQLEDLYLPFKKKRKTKAETARLNGLEPLAMLFWQQEGAINPQEEAANYLNPENGIDTIEKVLTGASAILGETISETAKIRQITRSLTAGYGVKRIA